MSSHYRSGIALGANLDHRLRSLTTAREHIFALQKVTPPFLSSHIYETDPVGCEAGARKFLNAVIEIGYEDSPEQLLSELQKIEAALGRPAEQSCSKLFGTHRTAEKASRNPFVILRVLCG